MKMGTVNVFARGSFPIQPALFPDVKESDSQDKEENNHLYKAEESQPFKNNRPWEKKNDLDVEEDKEHADQIEFNRESLVWRDKLRLSAFKRFHLVGELFFRPQDGGGRNHPHRDYDGENKQDQGAGILV